MKRFNLLSLSCFFALTVLAGCSDSAAPSTSGEKMNDGAMKGDGMMKDEMKGDGMMKEEGK